MATGFRARTAALPDGLFRPVGAAGQRRVAPSPSPWPARRATFGLSSLLLHVLVIGLSGCFIAKLALPDLPREAPVEMVFATASEVLPTPEALPEPVAEAQLLPPPDLTPADLAPAELSPPPEPTPEPTPVPALEPPPPRPKPPPRPVPRVVHPQPAVHPAEPAPAAAAAPVAAPTPPAAPPAIDPGWQSSVARWLASHKNYPDDARRRGDEGRVVIRFTVDRSGQVMDAEVVSSAGSSRLDDATLAMLRGAVLPAFPPTMSHDRVTVTTTVRYTLR